MMSREQDPCTIYIDGAADESEQGHFIPQQSVPHSIYKTIYDLKPRDKENHSNPFSSLERTEKIIFIGKHGIALAILSGRALSCFYRFVTSKDAILLFSQMPILNQCATSETVLIIADTAAGILTLADIIRTIDKSRKPVITLFTQEKWIPAIKDFYKAVCVGEQYSKKLIAIGFCAMWGSFVKGHSGTENVLQRLSLLLNKDVAPILPLSYYVGFSSLLCFMVFNVVSIGMWVVNTNKQLKNRDDWKDFESDNNTWLGNFNRMGLKAIRLMGLLLAIGGAFSSGIALFYKNHEFTFSTLNLILFFPIVVFGFLCTYNYNQNPVYLLDVILKTHHKEMKGCEECNQTAVVKKSEEKKSCESFMERSKNIIGFFSSTGGALTFCPAVIRPFQIGLYLAALATKNDQLNDISQNQYFILGGCLVALPFMIFSFLQDFAMWTGAPDKKPPSSEVVVNDNEAPASPTVSARL